jgi:signal transduction histidine kinase
MVEGHETAVLAGFDVLLAGETLRARFEKAEQRLALATLTAQGMQAAAEDALARNAASLAVAAHELRNPLAPILTAARLLDKVSPSDLPRLAALIERQVGHMRRMIDDLLDVSRVKSGKLRIERGQVDLAVVLDQVIETCGPSMDARRQRFHPSMPESMPVIDGDAMRLTQVFVNLLTNASKFTPVGGQIALKAVPDAAARIVLITVSDNGIGITPEALESVFEPFVQDPHAVEFDRTGLGLGLALARELVLAHGGTIDASSAGVARGSEFTVTLPYQRAA